MKKRLLIAGASVLAAVALGAGFLIGRARATGAPAAMPMTYSATLTDPSGAPLTGSKSIVLQIFDAATAGNMQCSVGPTSVTLVAGGFSVPLVDACTSAVHATADLWIEVFVDGASLGRTKLGAVPFALEADRAAKATGALDTRIASIESALISRTDTTATTPLRLCRGSTPTGNTAWAVYNGSTSALSLNVDMTSCGFTSKPIVFPVLAGASNHWLTTGGSNPYPPATGSNLTDATGFTIFINYTGGTVSPATANSSGLQWHVDWVALGN